ncbi:MAG TPA: NADH-quinone oxidoreductase subunit A [Microthrixaceae bacterium]|nr:NADH-quinone oxidoreductase subunit A [Microthrixaceae bacterium]
MGQYLPIVILAALAAGFGLVSLVINQLLAPSRPTPAQTAPYECGIVENVEPPTRFPVRFYLIAMIFIIFDIEIVFLYPFTMVFRDAGAFAFLAVVEFAVVVFAAFLYLISSGALDWGPSKKERRSTVLLNNVRAATGIRQVGFEGREVEGRGVDTAAAASSGEHEAA